MWKHVQCQWLCHAQLLILPLSLLRLRPLSLLRLRLRLRPLSLSLLRLRLRLRLRLVLQRLQRVPGVARAVARERPHASGDLVVRAGSGKWGCHHPGSWWWQRRWQRWRRRQQQRVPARALPTLGVSLPPDHVRRGSRRRTFHPHPPRPVVPTGDRDAAIQRGCWRRHPGATVCLDRHAPQVAMCWCGCGPRQPVANINNQTNKQTTKPCHHARPLLSERAHEKNTQHKQGLGTATPLQGRTKQTNKKIAQAGPCARVHIPDTGRPGHTSRAGCCTLCSWRESEATAPSTRLNRASRRASASTIAVWRAPNKRA